MRIAITTTGIHEVGGVQTYLKNLIPELAKQHQVFLLCEKGGDESFSSGSQIEDRSMDRDGAEECLELLRSWNPELIYAHGFDDPILEEKTIGIAPSIFFVHDYRNTCISGNKLLQKPNLLPCDRKFGWECLIHYFPNRCGGLSPVTMFQLFKNHKKHLELLRKYTLILTHSNHMKNEMLKHGFSGSHVKTILFPISYPSQEVFSSKKELTAPLQILFLGRMHFLKGGELLLDALPILLQRRPNPLRLVFAGDGPARKLWEEKAQKIRSEFPHCEILFPGNVTGSELQNLLESSQLHVIPSIWPEPFGSSGLEAGLFGIPSIGFAVGGVPEWLKDGVNGLLVRNLKAENLAESILKSVEDQAYYQTLSGNARQIAETYKMELHVQRLLETFHQITR